jgi:hypothetical protein
MSDTPRTDAALKFVERGASEEVLAQPDKWLVNVARELERENGKLVAAVTEWIAAQDGHDAAFDPETNPAGCFMPHQVAADDRLTRATATLRCLTSPSSPTNTPR